MLSIHLTLLKSPLVIINKLSQGHLKKERNSQLFLPSNFKTFNLSSLKYESCPP